MVGIVGIVDTGERPAGANWPVLSCVVTDDELVACEKAVERYISSLQARYSVLD